MEAIVVGSGIGGLAVAARLATLGHRVTVLEAAESVGGKLGELRARSSSGGEYRFDAGPSLFTLPALLDSVFSDAGRNPRDYYEYTRLETGCHYFFPDGARVRAHANAAAFAAEVEAELGEPRANVERYLAAAGRLYDDTAPVFLQRSLHHVSSLWNPALLRALWRLPTFQLGKTLHQVNQRRFRDPRVVQLFDRFATYNGSDPYRAPGVLAQIPHLEHNLGAFFPEGGMIQLPRALHRLGVELGVEVRVSTPVERILYENGRVTGVRLRSGESLSAPLVVSNADVTPTYRRLLPELAAPERTLSQERSSSAVIFYCGVRRRFEELGVHNIFFSSDYRTEFEEIFSVGVPADPTVYVHVSSKVEPPDAPPGCEAWFVMVNVGADQGQPWDTLIPALRQRVLAKLSRTLGVAIEPLLETEDLLEPRLIERRTSSAQGALYGSSSNTANAAFLRHPNFSRQLRGLYFCGGSVHPGGGIPLCLSGARIVADLVGPSREPARLPGRAAPEAAE